MSWTDAWNEIEERAVRLIVKFARCLGVLEFHLRLRSLLQLPRHSLDDLLIGPVLEAEIHSAAHQIAGLQKNFRELLKGNSNVALTSSLPRIDEVPEVTARIIHERFHYLGSFRTGRHFGLYLQGDSRPAALATVSPMDVIRLKHYVPEGKEDRIALLSRMFAFPWAPTNSLSWLLGAVGRKLRREADFDNLLTWVNPNLCFRGTSYKAANWTLVGSESIVYRYIDGAYITARQLQQVGTIAHSRISFSQFALRPLNVWSYQLH